MTAKKSRIECESCSSRAGGLFCHLHSGDFEEIDAHKTVNNYKKGQIIFYEANQAYGLYCINAGRVKLYKTSASGRQQIVRIAGPGDLLGYRCLVAEECYHATAEAIEDCRICCIDTKTFFETLSQNPELNRGMLIKLARELGKAEDLATSLAHHSVRERMAELLLLLKRSYGKQKENGTLIDLQLSREEMAEMIGATQETAIRLLSEFRKDGLIAVKDRDITILDADALIETAQLEY